MSLTSSVAVPPFDTESDPSSIGPRSIKWTQRFENYTTAINITGDARLKALMLHLARERVHIYDTMAAATDKYADTTQKLTGYFSPKKNVHDKSTYSEKQYSNQGKIWIGTTPDYACL